MSETNDVDCLVMRELLTRIYNSGYAAGRHDTVEGVFTDVHQSDMDSYHDDVVGELLEDLGVDEAHTAGKQLVSEKAIAYLHDQWPGAYKRFYELVDA